MLSRGSSCYSCSYSYSTKLPSHILSLIITCVSNRIIKFTTSEEIIKLIYASSWEFFLILLKVLLIWEYLQFKNYRWIYSSRFCHKSLWIVSFLILILLMLLFQLLLIKFRLSFQKCAFHSLSLRVRVESDTLVFINILNVKLLNTALWTSRDNILILFHV